MKKNSPNIALGDIRFSNPAEVLKYLKAEGYKIEKSKLYKDHNKIGRQKDGSYLKKDVDAYARLALDPLDGSGENTSGLARQKAELEIDLLEEKKRKETRENEIEEGKWVLKSEAEQKHTAKLALFLNTIDNFISGGKLEEAIELVGGNREKAPEFKAFIKKHLREMLGEYAKTPGFTVPKKTVAEAGELIRLDSAGQIKNAGD